MTTPINPSFDDCQCFFAEDAASCERRRRFETGTVEEIDSGMTFIDTDAAFTGSGFETFMAQHNWSDPVCMYRLAQIFEMQRKAAWKANEAAKRVNDEARLRRAG